MSPGVGETSREDSGFCDFHQDLRGIWTDGLSYDFEVLADQNDVSPDSNGVVGTYAALIT